MNRARYTLLVVEDDDLDIEYTYYGLLALGHLAL